MNQDATALFHADHNNDVAGGAGAAPSVATLNAAKTAMATQTDQSGNAILNILMKYVIVPRALESTANVVKRSEHDPDAVDLRRANVFKDTFEVVSDGRLDQADPAEWFAAGDPNITDTVEVAFLDGDPNPFLESKEGFTVDGVSYKVRLPCAAAALDYRALYRNDGN